MTTTVDTLEQRLEALVADRRWESSGSFSGCSAEKGNSIELDMVPPEQKLVVRVTDEAAESQLYYLKTEGYDPQPFHMPNGLTEVGETYSVQAITHTEDGLRISVGGTFMYVDSLAGLEFEIVDKDPVELANDRVRHPDLKVISNYEFNRATIERAQAEIDQATEQLAGLEEFQLDSPLRYSIAPSGIQVAELHDSELGPLKGFGRLREPQVYGKFHGNRFAIIGDKLMLIDDEQGLAVCPAMDLEERIICSFGRITVVDRTGRLTDSVNYDLKVSLTAASS